MAAQGGTGDKILRVSMPFEKKRNSKRKSRASIVRKRMVSGTAMDPWSVVLKVHSWAAQLKEGRVHSCAEIARREGITPARVSQLWPLSEITREHVDVALILSFGKAVSLRKLIRIAQNSETKSKGTGAENVVSG
jgi:hypothetical protein